jgi:competence protein ComEA
MAEGDYVMTKKKNYYAGCLLMTALLLYGCGKDGFTFTADSDGTQVGEESSKMQQTELPDGQQEQTGGSGDAGQASGGYDGAQETQQVIYELASGARVFQAIELAGGMLEEAAQDAVNQAELLDDGQQLVIPTKEELLILEEEQKQEQAAVSDGRVDINTADEAELCTIPGIGQVRAERIVAYRTEHGPFQAIEDIMQVSGIKSGLYEKIKDRIKVS